MRPKTIICDIDGTLIEHNGGPSNAILEPAIILKGTISKLEEWDKKGYNIVLLTGRKESMREKTEIALSSLGIFYDMLIMGVGGGQRVLINDLKPEHDSQENPTAIAINLVRNEGIAKVEL